MSAADQPDFRGGVRTTLLPAAALLFALVAGIFAWQQREGATDLTKQLGSLTVQLEQKNDVLQKRGTLIERFREQNEAYIKESAALRKKKSSPASNSQDKAASQPPS